jgi:hypothetical protein
MATAEVLPRLGLPLQRSITTMGSRELLAQIGFPEMDGAPVVKPTEIALARSGTKRTGVKSVRFAKEVLEFESESHVLAIKGWDWEAGEDECEVTDTASEQSTPWEQRLRRSNTALDSQDLLAKLNGLDNDLEQKRPFPQELTANSSSCVPVLAGLHLWTNLGA